MVFRGGDSVRIDLEWFTVNTNAWAVFAAGALTLLMLVLGFWLLVAGLKRSRATPSRDAELYASAQTQRRSRQHAIARRSTHDRHRASHVDRRRRTIISTPLPGPLTSARPHASRLRSGAGLPRQLPSIPKPQLITST